MKLSKLLLGYAVAAIAVGGGLVSCTNEFSESGFNKGDLSSIKLVKTPEVYAWSGSETLNSTNTATKAATRGHDVNGNQWYQNWDCPVNVWKPTHGSDKDMLTLQDLEEIKKLLSPGKETYNEIILPWENYWVQQVYKGEDNYYTHDRCLDDNCDNVNIEEKKEVGSDHMDLLLAFNNILENDWDKYSRYEFNNCMYEHVNNFNNGNNTTSYTEDNNGTHPNHEYFGTTLMTGMPTTDIDPNKQFGFHETYGTSPKYYNNYLIVEYKGYYYVGFDYEAHKDDQTTHNHNEGMDIPRDWNFTDWIVRISPAYPKGTNSDNPGGIIDDNTSSDNTCGKCDHPKHDGKCDDCVATECHPAVCEKCEHGVVWDAELNMFVHVVPSQTQGNCGLCESKGNPTCTDKGIVALDDEGNEIEDKTSQGTTTPATPSTPGYKNRHNNEVEVNLEIVDSHEDKGIKDLATKLSIHVRCATDVEIILPVPTRYTIDSDDLYIFQNHYIDGKNGVYGGSQLEAPGATVEYSIDGNLVKLHVQVMPATEDYPDGYMKVWTEGINDDVINYCMLHNGDGINFEVWTYYALENGDLTRTNLKNVLDKSTIKFNGPEDPTYYINAFGYDYVNGSWGQTNTGTINEDDCTVKPVENSGYNLEYTNATHLNGTPYNDIYVKSGKSADATHSNGSKPTTGE